MAVELINKIKTFNVPSLRTELAALTLPVMVTKFSGFEPTGLDRIQPFPEATRVIARKQVGGVVTEDTAARGDFRFETRDPLTPAEVTAITGVLDSHDGTVDVSSQFKRRQQLADISTLRTIFDGGISDPTLNLAVKLVLIDNGEDL